jgi:hypothetical protein
MLELTSMLNARHGDSALKTIRESPRTSTALNRASPNPAAAMRKIGRMSLAKMSRRSGMEALYARPRYDDVGEFRKRAALRR